MGWLHVECCSSVGQLFPSQRFAKSVYLFNEFAVVHQCALVLDVIGRDPCLDLVALALQLLDLLLQVGLVLFFLVRIRRRLNLFKDLLKGLDTLGDFF